MAEMISVIAGVFICTGTVLNAYFKTGEQEKKLIVKIGVVFPNGSVQYVWDTMCIMHSNLQTVMIGRSRAYKLALACGLSERPEDPSVLVGKDVQVSFSIDDNGNIKIRKYDKPDGKKTDTRVESENKDLF